MGRIIATIVLCVMLATPVWAGGAEGAAAYNRGDYATALRELRPFVEQGNASSQYLLGVMYANGEGVVQDYAEAVRWYRKAAAQGIASAQSNLGVMYSGGQGVVQDYAEAVRWYRKAAEQGYASAQYNLGVMYDNGHGVVQDYVQAHKWLNIAASRGDAKAANNREIVAKRMTTAQVAEAQRLARNWAAAFEKRKPR